MLTGLRNLILLVLYLIILSSWLRYKCIRISAFLSFLIKWLKCLMIIAHSTLVVFVHCIAGCLYVLVVATTMWFMISFTLDRQSLLLREPLNYTVDKLSCLLMYSFAVLLGVHLTNRLSHIIRKWRFGSASCAIYIESIVDVANAVWSKISWGSCLLLLKLLRLSSIFEKASQCTHCSLFARMSFILGIRLLTIIIHWIIMFLFASSRGSSLINVIRRNERTALFCWRIG